MIVEPCLTKIVNYNQPITNYYDQLLTIPNYSPIIRWENWPRASATHLTAPHLTTRRRPDRVPGALVVIRPEVRDLCTLRWIVQGALTKKTTAGLSMMVIKLVNSG